MKKVRILIFIIACLIITTILFLIFKPSDPKKPNTPATEIGPVVEQETKKTMSIVMAGDSLIHNGVYFDASIGNNQYDFTGMFTYIGPIISKYDLKYVNQESIIGGKNLGLSNYPLFNSPDEIGDALVSTGFNMVSLANNHSLDKGTTGLLYSTNYWKGKNIKTAGMYATAEDRNEVKVYEQNGIKYAFLAYTTTTNGLKAEQSYYLNVYSDGLAKKDIEAVKAAGAEVVIVAMHWGTEYTHTPSDEQRTIASYLSGLGVNLIIGTHPHVIQPIAYVGDTLVIYSLGNFISAQHSLGIAKIIGLLVGVDIVVDKGKVTFENLDYQLLYTYCTPSYKNFSVMPFSELNDSILANYKNIEQEYLAIVAREGL